MKVTNISNQKIIITLAEKIPTHYTLDVGDSIEVSSKIANINRIRRQIRIGENLTEVLPSGQILE